MLEAIVYNLPIILCAMIGIGLILLELFIPGFGVAGLSGITLLVISVWMTFSKHGALPAIILFILLSILIGVLMASVLRSVREGRLAKSSMVLNEQSMAEPDATCASDSLVGKTGVAISMLRPAGLAEIDGDRLNVLTEGEFIPVNTPVTVLHVSGNKIIVTPSNH